jgi:hypothetical protein
MVSWDCSFSRVYLIQNNVSKVDSTHPSTSLPWNRLSYITFSTDVAVMNIAILGDTAPCIPFMNRSFGGTCHIHLQCRKSADIESSMQMVARLNAASVRTSNPKQCCSRLSLLVRRLSLCALQLLQETQNAQKCITSTVSNLCGSFHYDLHRCSHAKQTPETQ